MVTLLAALADFMARRGLPPPLRGGAPDGSLPEGTDSLTLQLGPYLKVGLRFYV
jgi:hypothetical protein